LFSGPPGCCKQRSEVFLAADEGEVRALQDGIIVLKFGSSVLRAPADVPNAVHEIYRWYRSGVRVIAVVSAIGDATDRLLAEARQLAAQPEPYATAELLATGERASAALLGVALDRSGVAARVLNPREIGLTVTGTPLDSELSEVNLWRLRELLLEYPVLVIPGFFGTDSSGRTHVLGRGGSDLSAVFLAHAVGAPRCRLIKDVDGVYEADPMLARTTRPRRFLALTYQDALQVAAPLIQPKAVTFLEQRGSSAEVASCASGFESTVHGGSTGLGEAAAIEPSRVLLLGLGSVGFGVYQRLEANAGHFRIVGALVRDRGKYERLQVPAGLLRTRIEQISKVRADIVVDALPGIEPSGQLTAHFLSAGAHVVSANKALLAKAGVSLAPLAMRRGSTLSYSAAVGGSAPMIEAVDRCAAHAPIASIAAVLNGTCNFVLDRCAQGATLEEALDEARQAGFAESDSQEDTSGRDAARKLRILSRHAFSTEAEAVDLEALDERVARLAQDVAWAGMRLRQVARAARGDGEVRATVRFEEVPADSPFGRIGREWNALEILSHDGALQVVTGRGAGRWPTTEAVMADLFEAHRARTHQN
jgi:homoserine dehydrogenase